MKFLVLVRRTLHRHAVLVRLALCLVLLGLIAERGRDLQMHTLWHQCRLLWSGMPGAISTKYHGATPYATRANVQNLFFDHYDSCTDEVLARAATLDTGPTTEHQIFPADDKGAYDIAYLSLWLFGLRADGLFYTAVLMMAIGVAAHFAYYRDRPDRCLAPVLVLAALYLAMPAFRLTDQLFSFTNPRVFGVVAIIPFVHLMFAAYDRDRPSLSRVGLLALQVVLVTEAIHVRSSTAWMVIALVSLVGSRALWTTVRLLRGAPGLRPSAIVSGTWVVVLALSGMIGLKVYQKAMYPRFYNNYLEHHLVWHNIGIGLGLHPELAARYGLATDDGAMVGLVKQRVQERGDVVRYQQIFGTGADAFREGVAVDYAAYETEARRAVFHIVRSNPGTTAATVLYYKPRAGVRTFLWVAGCYSDRFDELYLKDLVASKCLASPEERAENSLHVRLYDPIVWLIVLGSLLVRLPSVRSASALLVISALTAFWSFLPPMLTYPLLHVVGECLVTTCLLVLSMGGWLVTLLLARHHPLTSIDPSEPVL